MSKVKRVGIEEGSMEERVLVEGMDLSNVKS